MDRCPMSNLQDVARETGAGSGCMSCHRMIRHYLSRMSSADCMGVSGFADSAFGNTGSGCGNTGCCGGESPQGDCNHL